MRALSAIATAFLCIATLSHADNNSNYGSLQHFEVVPEIIFLTGKIQSGDSFELRRAMRDHDISLVITASPGGNVYESLQMASIIRDNDVSTYIPERSTCASSCAIIFLGGKSRQARGNLGVHQFYQAGSEASRAERQGITSAVTQYTTADIIGILNQFQTPPFIYEKMFRNIEIYFLNDEELREVALNENDESFRDYAAQFRYFLSNNPTALKTPSVSNDPEPHTAPEPKASETEKEEFENIDFYGMDLTREGLRGVSKYQCERYCIRNENCAAWTYVKSSRWCWPKSGVENISLADGVVSGIVNSRFINPDVFNRPFLEASGIDIPGYDLYPKGLKNMSLDQCRHACQATTDCVAWSYITQKRWCWPKYYADDFVPSLGIISGVINEE